MSLADVEGKCRLESREGRAEAWRVALHWKQQDKGDRDLRCLGAAVNQGRLRKELWNRLEAHEAPLFTHLELFLTLSSLPGHPVPHLSGHTLPAS